MNEREQRVSKAFAQTFSGPQAGVCLDYLLLVARGFREPLERAGALQILGEIQHQLALPNLAKLRAGAKTAGRLEAI